MADLCRQKIALASVSLLGWMVVHYGTLMLHTIVYTSAKIALCTCNRAESPLALYIHERQNPVPIYEDSLKMITFDMGQKMKPCHVSTWQGFQLVLLATTSYSSMWRSFVQLRQNN
ncbi:hypothetical protein O6H91_16G022100 [Diphasiastrum complanatum]|uniref:Uncharacterized protein n=1 Tax=Diphasiastrum complanatum TaxID=34168 RepID=A0ACC2BAL9_DIPCM|nr:hypothetical protein O6H91_16G022100 [Diphasiastrum complanatum]